MQPETQKNRGAAQLVSGMKKLPHFSKLEITALLYSTCTVCDVNNGVPYNAHNAFITKNL